MKKVDRCPKDRRFNLSLQTLDASLTRVPSHLQESKLCTVSFIRERGDGEGTGTSKSSIVSSAAKQIIRCMHTEAPRDAEMFL